MLSYRYLIVDSGSHFRKSGVLKIAKILRENAKDENVMIVSKKNSRYTCFVWL
jgi:hypothetical protein